MGLSLSAAALVLFIGIVSVVPSAYNNMVADGFFRVQNAVTEIDSVAFEKQSTAVNITDYSVSAGNLTLRIENIGSVSVDPFYMNVLIDGIPEDITYDDVILFPLSAINATVPAPDAGEHRIKIVTIRGNSDYYEVFV